MSKQISIRFLLEVAFRRKWFLIVPLILCTVVSLLLVRTLPRFYRSTSLILVHPSEVSRDFVRGIVEYDVRRDLQNIEEQIYSRNWMERVVRSLELLPEQSEGPVFDALVAQMLNRVEVEIRTRTSFNISFSGKDPQTVFTVVQGLTQTFIDENLAQMAKADAEAAYDLDEEIATIEKELSTKEAKLAAYKQQHMGELPEQIEPNQRMLERLQMQQQLNGENLRDARNRQLILESQLRGLVDPGHVMGDPLVDDVLQARQALEDLKQNYTANHPDVIRAQARLTMLERQLENRGAPAAETGGRTEDTALSTVDTYSLALRNELENVKLNIQRLEGEEIRLREDIGRIEGRVEAAFDRQQELTQLTRDYENLEEYYRTLVDSKLNTRLSSRVLRTHSANQYEVLDPPRVPLHPYEPDPIRIVLLGIGCGLALGVVLCAGLEFHNDAFFSAESLEENMKMTVLATIPVLLDKSFLRRRRRRMAMAGIVVLLVVLAVGFINLFVVDLVALLRDFLNSIIQ
jgi:polysaccharide chain length determinant protein (PEP-CTERM system associated)